jgi:hypothetical protein
MCSMYGLSIARLRVLFSSQFESLLMCKWHGNYASGTAVIADSGNSVAFLQK